MEVREVLEQAADVIRERGWTQGENENTRTGQVCLAGAINIVTIGKATYEPSFKLTPGPEHADLSHSRRALDAVGVALGPPGWPNDPVEWQDAEGRTVDEVLDALERAAREAA